MEMYTRGLYPATYGIWIEPKRRAPGKTSAVVSGFMSWRKTIRQRRQMTRLMKTLSLLDDRLLRDIGLTGIRSKHSPGISMKKKQPKR